MQPKDYERLQTALSAIVSSQLLAEFLVRFEGSLTASPDETVLEFHQKFVQAATARHGLSGFSDSEFWLTKLPGMQLMYLFGALAIPKEVLHAEIPAHQREQLREVRNALAHGNFEIGSSHISLWPDREGRDGKRVDISAQDCFALNQLLVGILANELRKV